MDIVAPGLFLILCGVAPAIDTEAIVASQRVDLIELNHFVDQDGREVFRQILFYDWSDTHRRHVVRAWRLVKSDAQLPRRHWSPTRYQCVWNDDGLLREITAPALRETWSQTDPERQNQKLLPEDERVPLIQPKRSGPKPDRS